MKYVTSFLFALLICGTVLAQTEDLGEKYANTITAAELKTHLTIFASDYYEGRETGTRGLARAADYLATQYQLSGVKPYSGLGGYFQD